ncbi:hypothetical protein CAPTEDRAFT_221462 [Capitella teleta]|uniref:Death domain-containing protein n=1 Tax=Capitella teleta TaxID=283909 RepID=R7TUB7_CAPTE|nr:hypothetical protein CAPTEDRAFT_221462 [Capitella teleta]|eukprot:ELT97503.1 hypothetical protein CAPTEDRAFT_221462 [Capitella teleta]
MKSKLINGKRKIQIQIPSENGISADYADLAEEEMKKKSRNARQDKTDARSVGEDPTNPPLALLVELEWPDIRHFNGFSLILIRLTLNCECLTVLSGLPNEHAEGFCGHQSTEEKAMAGQAIMDIRDEKRRIFHRLIAELSPGKKGGEFSLPFGGKLIIPSGLLGKKDVVTCCMVSPSDRHKYQPNLEADEHLLSEIFLIRTSMRCMKKPIFVSLPFYQENTDLYDSSLLWRKIETDDWNTKQCTTQKSRNFEFETDVGGIFVMTSHLKKEVFNVPVQGCLYNSTLSHQVSVRFPKKATDVDITCEIQITSLNRDNMPNLLRDFPHDMADLLVASDIFTIKPSVAREYRRALTIKLPLPQMDDEDFPKDDIGVMQMTDAGWELIEAPIKFTKSSVMFDTKFLTKYCVALAKPGRRKRLKEAFKHLEAENCVVRGDVVAFLHLQEKLWTLWMECIPIERLAAVTEKRLKQGFVKVRVTEDYLQQEDASKPVFRQTWRSRRKQPVETEEKKVKRKDLDFVNGKVFNVDVSGDVVVCNEDSQRSSVDLQYHERLPENFRRFNVEPKPIGDGRIVTVFLKVSTEDQKEKKKVLCRTFEFDVESEKVNAYFYEPPEQPEIELLREAEPEIPEEPKRATPPPPPEPKIQKKQSTSSFARLTALTRPPRQIIRESKILTGRSLMNLAKEIEQGLTLAIHLDISDSCITGMGFDALANGFSLVDITYRILLLWKRKSGLRFKGDRQVQALVQALEEMGRRDTARVVAEQHKLNQELTPECFDHLHNE